MSKERPLSPHLQIYSKELTSVMSIMHRMTGIALIVGLLLVSWGLIALASGEEQFKSFLAFCSSGIGKLMLLGWTAALMYHLCNGIRHMIWDTGYLFELKNAYRAGYVVIAATVILTAAVWFIGTKHYNGECTHHNDRAAQVQQEAPKPTAVEAVIEAIEEKPETLAVPPTAPSVEELRTIESLIEGENAQ